MSKLRPYQMDLIRDTYAAWDSGTPNVLGVLPTGAGKSVVAAHVMADESAPSLYTAHRGELVLGESLALARNGVRHRVLGPPALRRECSRLHVAEGLHNHVDPNARAGVGSVDTILNMINEPWLKSVRLVVPDEAAHVLRANKWGRMLGMMPGVAHLLGPTATPYRADGKGLGRHADGLMDVMIIGPSPRELELLNHLSPHRIYAPPSDIDLSSVPLSASGDYSPKPLSEAVHRSHILGDVVSHYLTLASGKLGMTFCADVEHASETAAAYRAAGVPAEVVTGKTAPEVRNAIFRRFRNRDILQMVGVDVFSEGTDVPETEVISLARPSESYSLVTQQIGRVKRYLAHKPYGIVIDHVGNVARHFQAKRCGQNGEFYIAVGEREWTLDRRERRSDKKPEISVTTCPSCLRTYERVVGRTCPYCSHTTEPVSRGAPEFVDGVLAELNPAALAELQGEINRIDGPAQLPFGASRVVGLAVAKRHRERQEAQAELRETMAQWCGERTQATSGPEMNQAQREFWLTYGVDVATAQALGKTEAENLRERIDASVNKR